MTDSLNNSIQWLDNHQTDLPPGQVQRLRQVIDALINNRETAISPATLARSLAPQLYETLQSTGQEATYRAICAFIVPNQSLDNLDLVTIELHPFLAIASSLAALEARIHCLLLAGRHQQKIANTLSKLEQEQLVNNFPNKLLISLGEKAYYLELIEQVTRANPYPPLPADIVLAIAACIASDAFFAENATNILTQLSAHGLLAIPESARIIAAIDQYKDHIADLEPLFSIPNNTQQFRADNVIAMIEAVGSNGYYTESVCNTLQLLLQHNLCLSENAPTLITLIGEHGELADQVALLIRNEEDGVLSFEKALKTLISLIKSE